MSDERFAGVPCPAKHCEGFVKQVVEDTPSGFPGLFCEYGHLVTVAPEPGPTQYEAVPCPVAHCEGFVKQSDDAEDEYTCDYNHVLEEAVALQAKA